MSNPALFLSLFAVDDDEDIDMGVHGHEISGKSSQTLCRKLEKTLAKEINAVWELANIVIPENTATVADGSFVHAQVIDKPMPASLLSIPHDNKEERERMMAIIGHARNSIPRMVHRRTTISGDSCGTDSQTSSSSLPMSFSNTPQTGTTFGDYRRHSSQATASTLYNSSSNDFQLLPQTVLTVPFNVVRRPLREGFMSLLG